MVHLSKSCRSELVQLISFGHIQLIGVWVRSLFSPFPSLSSCPCSPSVSPKPRAQQVSPEDDWEWEVTSGDERRTESKSTGLRGRKGLDCTDLFVVIFI